MGLMLQHGLLGAYCVRYTLFGAQETLAYRVTTRALLAGLVCFLRYKIGNDRWI